MSTKEHEWGTCPLLRRRHPEVLRRIWLRASTRLARGQILRSLQLPQDDAVDRFQRSELFVHVRVHSWFKSSASLKRQALFRRRVDRAAVATWWGWPLAGRAEPFLPAADLAVARLASRAAMRLVARPFFSLTSGWVTISSPSDFFSISSWTASR